MAEDPNKDGTAIKLSLSLTGERARQFKTFVATLPEAVRTPSKALRSLVYERLDTIEQGAAGGLDKDRDTVLRPLYGAWSWMRHRAPALALVVAIGLVGLGAIDWTLNSADTLRKVGSLLGLWAEPMDPAELQILKAQYPLEPLSATFEITYNMDDPELSTYSQRLQKSLVQWLREARQDRAATSDDLHDEKIIFVVTNLKHNGMDGLEPNPDDAAELVAAKVLLWDQTSLYFTNPATKKAPLEDAETIHFGCMPESMREVVVHLPSFGPVEQTISLNADFANRQFIKRVECRTLPRFEPNRNARSAIDLVGRRLIWDNGTGMARDDVPKGQMTRIAFGLPNDIQDGYDSSRRFIDIDAGQAAVEITADHLGFAGLLR